MVKTYPSERVAKYELFHGKEIKPSSQFQRREIYHMESETSQRLYHKRSQRTK